MLVNEITRNLIHAPSESQCITLLKIRDKSCTQALPIARRGKQLLQLHLVSIDNTSSFLMQNACNAFHIGNGSSP